MRLTSLSPLFALLLAAGCMGESGKPRAEDDFKIYCAACHGVSGEGNGEIAKQLAKKPADLTGLSARNGGAYPATKVMAKIWGAKDDHAVMPEFAALMESELVPFDGGDGIMTPTPIRLVQISDYLRKIQR